MKPQQTTSNSPATLADAQPVTAADTSEYTAEDYHQARLYGSYANAAEIAEALGWPAEAERMREKAAQPVTAAPLLVLVTDAGEPAPMQPDGETLATLRAERDRMRDALRAIATDAGLAAAAFPNAPGNGDLQSIVRHARAALGTSGGAK